MSDLCGENIPGKRTRVAGQAGEGLVFGKSWWRPRYQSGMSKRLHGPRWSWGLGQTRHAQATGSLDSFQKEGEDLGSLEFRHGWVY